MNLKKYKNLQNGTMKSAKPVDQVTSGELSALRTDKERISVVLWSEYTVNVKTQVPTPQGIETRSEIRKETGPRVVHPNYPVAVAKAFSKVIADKIATKSIKPKNNLMPPPEVTSVTLFAEFDQLDSYKTMFNWFLNEYCAGSKVLPILDTDPLVSALKAVEVAKAIQATHVEALLEAAVDARIPSAPKLLPIKAIRMLLKYPKGHPRRNTVVDKVSEAILWPHAAQRLDKRHPTLLKLREEDPEFDIELEAAISRKEAIRTAKEKEIKKREEEVQEEQEDVAEKEQEDLSKCAANHQNASSGEESELAKAKAKQKWDHDFRPLRGA